MAVVEIAVSGEPLAVAYTPLSEKERRSFLEAVLSQPMYRQTALELLSMVQAKNSLACERRRYVKKSK